MTETTVLFDTENLFHPFGERIHLDRGDIRTQIHLLFPTVPERVVLTLGVVIADEVIDWIDGRSTRKRSRSFGKFHDKGVVAVRAALEERGFTHTDVPNGRNMADLAVNDAATACVAAAASGHLTLGGSDKLVLGHARHLRDQSHGAWDILVIARSSRSPQYAKITGGQYSDIRSTALDLIRHDEIARRRGNAVLRAVYRSRVRQRLQRHIEREDEGPAARFSAVIQAVPRVRRAFDHTDHRDRSWFTDLVQELCAAGLDTDLAEGIASSVDLQWEDSGADHPASLHESLFRAAVEVCLDGRLSTEASQVVFQYIRSESPHLLLPLERAMALLRPPPVASHLPR